MQSFNEIRLLGIIFDLTLVVVHVKLRFVITVDPGATVFVAVRAAATAGRRGRRLEAAKILPPSSATGILFQAFFFGSPENYRHYLFTPLNIRKS